MRPILIVPGYRDSGPEHWQTLFETKLPGADRVRMPSFDVPDPEGWLVELDRAIAAAPAPPVLVAHSLGCIAVARWSAARRRPVHGALLVAPADVEKRALPAPVRAFAPIPTEVAGRAKRPPPRASCARVVKKVPDGTFSTGRGARLRENAYSSC